MKIDIELQRDIEALYTDYASLLDDGPLEQWPDLFAADCLYLVIPRENFEQGLPLAIMRCESRAMLCDRVRSVRETILFEPRTLRHQITNIQATRTEDPGDEAIIEACANYLVIEVLQNEFPRILSVGRYVSVLQCHRGSGLKILQQRVIYDSVMVPNTIVYPL